MGRYALDSPPPPPQMGPPHCLRRKVEKNLDLHVGTFELLKKISLVEKVKSMTLLPTQGLLTLFIRRKLPAEIAKEVA